MEKKRLQELEKNELAKWFNAQYEDWIQPNRSWLGYAILGVLIIGCIIYATASVNAWNQRTAWQQYHAALNSPTATTDLEILANSTSSVVGAHARLALAQRQLAEGSEQVFIDKNEAIRVLENAVASFQLAQRATNDPTILQQAGFGLGQAWEALAAARVGETDLANAKEAYQNVVTRWGDGFMGLRAARQLALLQQPATRTFLELTAAKVIEAPFAMPFMIDNPFEQRDRFDFSLLENLPRELFADDNDNGDDEAEEEHAESDDVEGDAIEE